MRKHILFEIARSGSEAKNNGIHGHRRRRLYCPTQWLHGLTGMCSAVISKNMAERVGLEFSKKRFNNIGTTASDVKAMEDRGKQRISQLARVRPAAILRRWGSAVASIISASPEVRLFPVGRRHTGVYSSPFPRRR